MALGLVLVVLVAGVLLPWRRRTTHRTVVVPAPPLVEPPALEETTPPQRHRGGVLVGVLLVLGVVLPWGVPALPAALTRAYDAVVAEPATAPRPPADPLPAAPIEGQIPGDAYLAAAFGVTGPGPEYLQGDLASAGRPVRVRVPRLGVNAPVLPISGQSGILTPPDDPSRLGWWREGRPAGAGTGAAVITGHTVHTGGGALNQLGTLRRGDTFRVTTARGEITYTVLWQRDYRTTDLAALSSVLFSQGDAHRLLLVTCSGWNGRSYDFSAVALARPTGEVPRKQPGTPRGAPPVGGAPRGLPVSAGAGGGVVDLHREHVALLRGDRRADT